MEDEILVCPRCDGEHLFVRAETTYHLNTGEFYCHSVKTHDDCAKVTCNTKWCAWSGTLADVKGGAA